MNRRLGFLSIATTAGNFGGDIADGYGSPNTALALKIIGFATESIGQAIEVRMANIEVCQAYKI